MSIIQLKNVSNKHDIDALVREEMLQKAERERKMLENKLTYLSQSINMLRGPESPRDGPARYGSEEE